MHLYVLKAKLHQATVTDADLHYEGSITIDRKLLEVSGILPYEQVQVYNITNGERFTTYVIEGNEGEICINGAAAWKARKDDKVIIAAYCMLNEVEYRDFKPRLVYLGENNSIKSKSS